MLPPVGSRVRLRFGTADVIATVTEHRGPLAVGGRELLALRFQFEHSADPIELEIPLDEVTVLDDVA
jgi:hypothetical protein